MKRGVAIWTFDAPDLETRIKTAADAGFECVSLTAPLLADARGQLDSVKRLLDELDIFLTLHLAFGTSSADEVVGSISRDIEGAAELQNRTGRVLNVTFDSAYRPEEVEGGKVWNARATIVGLKYALEQLVPLGIKVGIENWLINHRLDQFKMMKEEVGRDDLCMLLDIGHLYIASKTPEVGIPSMRDWVEAVPMEIVELHLHDNDGCTDQHLPLGEGSINLQPIVEALARRRFDGVATVEVGLRERPLDEVVRKLTRTLEAFETAFLGAKTG